MVRVLRLPMPARPNSPKPNRAMVAGSGTALKPLGSVLASTSDVKLSHQISVL